MLMLRVILDRPEPPRPLRNALLDFPNASSDLLAEAALSPALMTPSSPLPTPLNVEASPAVELADSGGIPPGKRTLEIDAVVVAGKRVVPEACGLGSSAPKKLGSRFGREDAAALPPGRTGAALGLAASSAGLRALLADDIVEAVKADLPFAVPVDALSFKSDSGVIGVSLAALENVAWGVASPERTRRRIPLLGLLEGVTRPPPGRSRGLLGIVRLGGVLDAALRL